MSIRLSTPLPAQAAHLNPRLDRSMLAANDNGPGANDAVLGEALRYFARHGLAAAGNARREAEAAFFAGDRPGYQRWLEICRALDRRMAAAVAAAAGAV